MRVPILKEGVLFLVLFGGASVFFGWKGKIVPFLPSLMLFLFSLLFFRNPPREAPEEEGVIVSPADGRVVAIEETTYPSSREKSKKVSVFMSLFDVHVNRVPLDGEVEEIRYSPGRFLPAFRSEASSRNEQNMLSLRGEEGKVVVVQVAGILARRIICYLRPGQEVRKGDLLGAILLGSRVDLYLPPEVILSVRLGERVKGGVSVVGRRAT